MGDRKFLLDPKHWRDRVDETLVKAELAKTPDIRDRLLKIAQEYQNLADRAERWRSVETAAAANEPVVT